MELYILDSLLRRTAVVDRFDSLIWTERFSDVGEFELDIHSTVENRRALVSGLNLAMNLSTRVMVIETIEDSYDTEGKATLKIKGRSLEKILEDRVAKATMANLTTEPKWVLNGTPPAICRQIFNDICVTGTLSTTDRIPYYTAGTMYPPDTIGEPSTAITVSLDPTTVLDAIKNLCEMYDMGFRLTRNGDASQLYFNIYMGSDRTTGQTTLPAVVFSPDLDNLQNTSELSTISGFKNVAYVFCPAGSKTVMVEGTDPAISGFDKRILVVVSNDITDVATADAQMQQLGLQELAKNRRYSAFDGEINQNSSYKYGVHYQLGDMIEVRNTDGVTNKMQVSEQIFVSDKEGERSYPTLQINTFITPGSWLSWDYNKVWMDYDADTTTTWSTLP